MDSKTREMILGWLADHKGDSEAVARFMRVSAASWSPVPTACASVEFEGGAK